MILVPGYWLRLPGGPWRPVTRARFMLQKKHLVAGCWAHVEEGE